MAYLELRVRGISRLSTSNYCVSSGGGYNSKFLYWRWPGYFYENGSSVRWNMVNKWRGFNQFNYRCIYTYTSRMLDRYLFNCTICSMYWEQRIYCFSCSVSANSEYWLWSNSSYSTSNCCWI